MTDCNGHHEEPELQVLPDWKKVFVSREEFLKLISISLGGFIGLVATLPGAAFILNYLFVPKRPTKWVNIGPLEGFKQLETRQVSFHDPYILPWDGVSGHRAAWVRRGDGEDFTAFAVNCTHLGCPVRWEDKAELFMCPCHGGVYYKDGEVAGGPPPKPLHQYPIRVDNGDVKILVGTILLES